MKKLPVRDGIAPWKLDSPLERLLSRWADHSDLWKKAYAGFYRIFDRDYYQKGLKLIDRNIDLFEGEVTPECRDKYIIDMVYSLHRFGCMFDEYFLYRFPVLNTEGRDSFLTDKLRWDAYARMNTDKGNEIFNDKKKAYDHFGRFYHREVMQVESGKDKDSFIEFSKRHTEVIIKPKNGSGGRGIHFEDFSRTSPDEVFDEIMKCKGGCVVEERIIQSGVMSSLYPDSVNTVRFTTIRTGNGVQPFHPLLRTGCGGGMIDNATAGGIFALIDPEEGVVFTCAKDEKGRTFLRHPDTGVAFPGFQLPDWDGALALVKELSTVVEEDHYVGWDLAHTENGWIMVEGNPRGQQIMMQLFYPTGFKAEIEKYISEM